MQLHDKLLMLMEPRVSGNADGTEQDWGGMQIITSLCANGAPSTITHTTTRLNVNINSVKPLDVFLSGGLPVKKSWEGQ